MRRRKRVRALHGEAESHAGMIGVIHRKAGGCSDYRVLDIEYAQKVPILRGSNPGAERSLGSLRGRCFGLPGASGRAELRRR